MRYAFAFTAVTAFLITSAVASAAVKMESVGYADGDQKLEGVAVYDDAVSGKRPGVVVVHQWMGITDHERMIARRLAELGYVAFIADIYGKGVRPADRAAAAKLSGSFKEDRKLLRERVNLALAQLKDHKLTDNDNTAAIGFCFGGTTVLELARSGASVDGVVSFHGGLATPTPGDAQNIKGKVLVLHGAADPYVPLEEVVDFTEEMTQAGVDWHMTAYGGAVHSFTQKEAGNDPSKGAAYDEKAAQRSWEHMKMFLDELWGAKRG